MASAVIADRATCARCGRDNHASRNCPHLTFYCDRKEEAAIKVAKEASWQAQRDACQAERARRHAEWEAREAERVSKRAQWEAKQREWQRRQDAKAARAARRALATDMYAKHSSDTRSNATESTCEPLPCDPELDRGVSMDKDVRKLAKKLRQIQRLEDLPSLDPLQVEKLTSKSKVEAHLEWAKVLARLRAQQQLKCPACHSSA